MRRAAALVCAAVAAGCGRAGAPPAADAAATPPAAEAATSPRSCLRLDLAPLKIVRVDEPQRRLFVSGAGAGEALDARIRDLESCFGFTEWAGRWSLSVFADGALARYKDDPQVVEAVKDGRWARAYLAEYDAATKKTTRNPAGSK